MDYKKSLFFGLMSISLWVIAACQQTPPQGTVPDEFQGEEPPADEAAPQCTESWVCKNENTRAYRTADCRFEQESSCSGGCVDGQCKEVPQAQQPISQPAAPSAEGPTAPAKTSAAPTKNACEPGYACLDSKRVGYRRSDCSFDNVDACPGSCTNGKCIPAEAQEAAKQAPGSTIEGTKAIGIIGDSYFDFSLGEVFMKDTIDRDMKVYLFSPASGYTFIKASGSSANIWVIEKDVASATFADCEPSNERLENTKNLYSGQTLCVITHENKRAMLGGVWPGVPDFNTVMTWRYFP